MNNRLNGKATPKFSLHHDAWGQLVLTDGAGRQFVGAEPVRAFPITDPEHGIALCDADGNEVLWIDDLTHVPEATRTILDQELARRHFLPVIKRVVRIDGTNEPTRWHVE